jgi:hypothetical protein
MVLFAIVVEALVALLALRVLVSIVPRCRRRAASPPVDGAPPVPESRLWAALEGIVTGVGSSLVLEMWMVLGKRYVLECAAASAAANQDGGGDEFAPSDGVGYELRDSNHLLTFYFVTLCVAALLWTALELPCAKQSPATAPAATTPTAGGGELRRRVRSRPAPSVGAESESVAMRARGRIFLVTALAIAFGFVLYEAGLLHAYVLTAPAADVE